MTTAHDVVADYLKERNAQTKPQRQRAIVADATREIVDELPDGFTIKDVRTCVAALVDENNELDGFTPSRRNRQITKTVNDLVAANALKLEGELYFHETWPQA